VRRMHRRLLIVESVAGDLAALAEENELIGRVPGLDDVEPLGDEDALSLSFIVVVLMRGADSWTGRALVSSLRRWPF
jgi:hypothetical protein